MNRSWRAKRATGTKQRDSAGISIGERVEATEGPAEGVGGGQERQSPEPELARGKKTLTETVRVLRMVEPTANR